MPTCRRFLRLRVVDDAHYCPTLAVVLPRKLCGLLAFSFVNLDPQDSGTDITGLPPATVIDP